MTSTERLQQKITELEGDLLEARAEKKYIYIHETHHLYCSDGEMHFGFGDDKWLVYNTDQLFKDLPFIINQVIKENGKMQRHYLDQIQKELLNIKVEGENEYMDIEDQVVNDPEEIPLFEGTLDKLNKL
tara:strand:+ start:2101 stop:2487 length:387 start_codon:yes stop_codon:yes gene_type:complete